MSSKKEIMGHYKNNKMAKFFGWFTIILMAVSGIAAIIAIFWSRPTPSVISSTWAPIEEVKNYEDTEKLVIVGGTFFEKMPKIKTEQAYLAYPMQVDPAFPSTLIVYSHGSNTTVTTNMNDQFMKDMRVYGEFFTARGYAFSASSMHGANWGSADSQNDMNNQIGK